MDFFEILDKYERRSWSGYKLFDTLILFLKDFFFWKSGFWRKSADNKSMKNYSACEELKLLLEP